MKYPQTRKDNAIDIVKKLYPPDSQLGNANIGQSIMLQAIAEYWEELPEQVIIRMAQLCEIRERE